MSAVQSGVKTWQRRSSDKDENQSSGPKQWSALGENLIAHLLTLTRKGKVHHLLTSMTNPLRYTGGEMVDLYGHRLEIELCYREIKQTMLLSRLTLRSKKPEPVERELWGVLLAYNLVRYYMIKMAKSLEGYWPNQLGLRAE